MHKPDDELQQPSGLPYATDEVSFPILGKAAILLLIFTIFSTALASSAYWLFVVHETVKPAQVLEATPTQPDPNVPVLQTDPMADIRKFRADEYDAEHAYAHWQDGDGKTSLRIPISRAMEIVKANGLPKAVKAEPAEQKPNGAPGVSGVGPVNNSPTGGPTLSPPGGPNSKYWGAPSPGQTPTSNGAPNLGATGTGAPSIAPGTPNSAAEPQL